MVEAVMNTTREERVKGTDDIRLFVRSWRPDGTARGVVALVPGFNAHSGYYGWAAEQLTASGNVRRLPSGMAAWLRDSALTQDYLLSNIEYVLAPSI